MRNITGSNLHLLSGNLTRNRGTAVIAEEIVGKTNISVENNDFRQSGFRNNTMINLAIELRMSENDEGLCFIKCQILNMIFFQWNTAE